MADTLSEEEFHRMQMQMIELRTENYQLKDDNKKNKVNIIQLQQNTLQFEREINKLTKLKKALTALGKSKQAHEFEELLQQNEQAFIMQNQTLMEELSKLQATITKLENEKKLLQQDASYAAPDKEKESEIRNLKATNSALQKSNKATKETHENELKKLQQKLDSVNFTNTPDKASDQIDEVKSETVTDETSSSGSINSSIMENNLVQSLQDQTKKYSELQFQFETSQEEKKLLEKEMEDAIKEHKQEIIELKNLCEEFKSKYEQKQNSYTQLQSEMAELQTYKSETSKLVAKYQEDLQGNNKEITQLKSAHNSSKQAISDAHNKIREQQQAVQILENQISSNADSTKTQTIKYQETVTKAEFLEKEVSSLKDKLKYAHKEKEEAVGLFQKSTLASTALLTEQETLEKECDKLRNDVQEALNLAEKRKDLADKQAIETQEITAKMNHKIEEIHKEYEQKMEVFQAELSIKQEDLKEQMKDQEDELIRLRQLERSRTRELDAFQQQVNDLTTAKSSLENSKGWFERALKDAESLAQTAEERYKAEINDCFQDKEEEMERLLKIIESKEHEIADVRSNQASIDNITKEYEDKITRLKQEIKDEVHKQKLVEKKVHTTIKDLKKQLTAERKKAEALQQKLQQQSNSHVDELLTVVNSSDKSRSSGADGASSVSSFSFKDFISPKNNSDKPSPNHSAASKRLSSSPVLHLNQLTSTETSDLLERLTELQNEKWALEEKVKHLEESAGAMADELVDKSQMIQEYVQHTRTDRVKRIQPEQNSSSLRDKVRSFVTGNEDSVGIGNIRELNKKLTRMLEEEMTKNLALKQDMELMAQELSKIHTS